jgi:hypothetical protein
MVPRRGASRASRGIEEVTMARAVRRAGQFIMRYRGVVAAVLIAAAVLLTGLYRVADGAEHHSYNAGAVPPMTVKLTSGHTYEISVPGGRDALKKRGISTQVAQCSWTQGPSGKRILKVTPVSADVRATHAIATFTSPVSGAVHIDCAGWGAAYVDDADDSGWDYAGLFLLLATTCLTAAVALGISALYARGTSQRAARYDDEIETGVETLAADPEVGGADGGYVAR